MKNIEDFYNKTFIIALAITPLLTFSLSADTIAPINSVGQAVNQEEIAGHGGGGGHHGGGGGHHGGGHHGGGHHGSGHHGGHHEGHHHDGHHHGHHHHGHHGDWGHHDGDWDREWGGGGVDWDGGGDVIWDTPVTVPVPVVPPTEDSYIYVPSDS